MSEKCPWCKEPLDYETLPTLEEECLQITCDHCNKKFWAHATVEYYFNRDCTNNGMEHEWEGLPGSVFSCKNCDEIK